MCRQWRQKDNDSLDGGDEIRMNLWKRWKDDEGYDGRWEDDGWRNSIEERMMSL